MKKTIIVILVFSLLSYSTFVKESEANGKLILGVILTGAGIVGIITGTEEYDVLSKEYDFTTAVGIAVYDPIMSTYITEWEDYAIDPDPETIVEKDKIVSGYEYGTNGYIILVAGKVNHHKVYETEKRMAILGKIGLVSTGIGVTLIVDYLLTKTGVGKKAGIEVKTVTKPNYSGLQLVKRY